MASDWARLASVCSFWAFAYPRASAARMLDE
ncbi:hypothetical protein [Achromobacter phage ewik_TL4]|nr:hypothetical protein [Achromobacter phage ewik_TL4]